MATKMGRKRTTNQARIQKTLRNLKRTLRTQKTHKMERRILILKKETIPTILQMKQWDYQSKSNQNLGKSQKRITELRSCWV